MKNLVKILYDYQSDEGGLSKPVHFEEEEQLEELSAKIMN